MKVSSRTLNRISITTSSAFLIKNKWTHFESKQVAKWFCVSPTHPHTPTHTHLGKLPQWRSLRLQTSTDIMWHSQYGTMHDKRTNAKQRHFQIWLFYESIDGKTHSSARMVAINWATPKGDSHSGRNIICHHYENNNVSILFIRFN